MFENTTIQAFKEYCISKFPEEACGLIIDGQFVPKGNIAADPTRDFLIDDMEYAAALATGKLEAVVHSHPVRNLAMISLSVSDMRGQTATGVPWGVVTCDGSNTSDVFWWGEGVSKPPLLGRPFAHGIYDCYSLIKDFYKDAWDIGLPEFPREWDWWNKGQNMYLEKYTSAGFKPIGPSEVRAGDVFLAQIRSPVVNHGGIVLDGGLVLHQLQDRISCREPLATWTKLITHYLRYDGDAANRIEEGVPARLFG